MKKLETISVVLCTCNGEKYLEAQLDSLLSQTRPADEIIVLDDASVDKSMQIIEHYRAVSPVPLRAWQNESRLGARKNFEKGIASATGDLIFLCDQDDVWDASKLERTLEYLQGHPELDAVFANGRLFSENGIDLSLTMWDALGFEPVIRNGVTPATLLEYILLNGNIVTGTTMAFRRSALHGILPIQSPYNIWHDHWIGLNFAARGALFFIDEPLLNYRVHAAQQVGFDTNLKNANNHRVLWQPHHFEADPDGDKTLRLVHALYLCEQLAALSANFKASSIFLETFARLRQKMDQLKTNWLRASYPLFPRKQKLLKHWLRGGEYLRINWKDLVSI